MFRYANVIQDDRGNALPGWQVECVELDTTTVVPIYSDENETPIVAVSGVADRAVSDSAGNYEFYVAEGTYSLRFYDATGAFQRAFRYFTMYGNAAETVQGAVESTAADAATAAAAAAEAVDARNAAVSAAAVYEDTTAGLAGTSDGEFFQIPSASPLGYTDLYLNDGGTAVLQDTLPNKSYFDSVVVAPVGVYVTSETFEEGGYIAEFSRHVESTFTRLFANVVDGPCDIQVRIDDTIVAAATNATGELEMSISATAPLRSQIVFYLLNGGPSAVWAQIDGGIAA